LADCCLILVSFGSSSTSESFDLIRTLLCGWLLCLRARQAVDGLELWPWAGRIIVVSPPLRLLHPPPTVDCWIPRSIPALSISYLIDSKGSGANCLTGPSSRAHLVPKSSPNMKSPHLLAAAGAISLAPRQNWRPREQRRQGTASAMVLDGFCGHRPMIWRPSNMVSVVDERIKWLGVASVGRRVVSFHSLLCVWWLCELTRSRGNFILFLNNYLCARLVRDDVTSQTCTDTWLAHESSQNVATFEVSAPDPRFWESVVSADMSLICRRHFLLSCNALLI
jgi:hypothetical protein